MQQEIKEQAITFVGGNVVDVSVSERPTGDGVAADADGREGSDGGEDLKQLPIRHVRVEVTHIQRCRYRHRHWDGWRNCHSKQQKSQQAKDKRSRVSV